MRGTDWASLHAEEKTVERVACAAEDEIRGSRKFESAMLCVPIVAPCQKSRLTLASRERC